MNCSKMFYDKIIVILGYGDNDLISLLNFIIKNFCDLEFQEGKCNICKQIREIGLLVVKFLDIYIYFFFNIGL